MMNLFAYQALLAQGGPHLVQGMTIFFIAGFLMVFGALMAGKLLRPSIPHPEKLTPYECGEPAIGSSWVQFDLRFYVVALVFLVFDVEIALFYPWAVVYGGGSRPEGTPAEVLHQIKLAATYDMLFFFAVLVVGFLYLWRFGYLDWVRASTGARGSWVAPPPGPDKLAAGGMDQAA